MVNFGYLIISFIRTVVVTVRVTLGGGSINKSLTKAVFISIGDLYNLFSARVSLIFYLSPDLRVDLGFHLN